MGDEVHIIAEGLLDQVREKLSWGETPVVARFTGAELVGDTATGRNGRTRTASGPGAGAGVLILGDHVTLEAGTGCVHTAPGHGAEDFVVGREYDLEPFNPVGDDGRFLPDRVGPEWLKGEYVLEANAEIVEDLQERGLLLLQEDYIHSYPHCWRCKKPGAVPLHAAVVHLHGRRRPAATRRWSRSTRGGWLPAFGEERIAR